MNAKDNLVLSLSGMTLWPLIFIIIAIISKIDLNTFVHSEVSILVLYALYLTATSLASAVDYSSNDLHNLVDL